MSDPQQFRLVHDAARAGARRAIDAAPAGFVVTVSPPKRSAEQNAKFHAICSDVARQARFMGRKLTPLQWKTLFVSGHAIATEGHADMVPGLEGEFVNIRESTSEMTVPRKASLIEYTLAWCAGNGIQLREVTARGYEDLVPAARGQK